MQMLPKDNAHVEYLLGLVERKKVTSIVFVYNDKWDVRVVTNVGPFGVQVFADPDLTQALTKATDFFIELEEIK